MDDSLHFLIVEDDLSYALELEIMLFELGYGSVAKVSDLAEARRHIKVNEPDLIISDIFLSSTESGITLAEEMLRQNIPTILITSNQDQDTYQRARSALPIAYLIKPVNKINLQATIERCLIQQGNPVFIEGVLQQWQQRQIVLRHLFVRHSGKLTKLKIEDISCISADGNYCYLKLGSRKFAMKSSLRSIKKTLVGSPFIQINRGTLINFNFIDSVSFSKAEVYAAGETFVLGAMYREELAQWINKV